MTCFSIRMVCIILSEDASRLFILLELFRHKNQKRLLMEYSFTRAASAATSCDHPFCCRIVQSLSFITRSYSLLSVSVVFRSHKGNKGKRCMIRKVSSRCQVRRLSKLSECRVFAVIMTGSCRGTSNNSHIQLHYRNTKQHGLLKASIA